MVAKMRRRCGTQVMPLATISSTRSPWIGLPSNLASPDAGVSRPMITLSVVDLPAPLAPIMATTCPFLTWSERSNKIWALP